MSEFSDQGKYQCAARNSAGTRFSDPAPLYVRGKDHRETHIKFGTFLLMSKETLA